MLESANSIAVSPVYLRTYGKGGIQWWKWVTHSILHVEAAELGDTLRSEDILHYAGNPEENNALNLCYLHLFYI